MLTVVSNGKASLQSITRLESSVSIDILISRKLKSYVLI